MLRSLSYIVALGLALAAPLAGAQGPPLDRVRLPDGFRIEVVAQVPGARAMAWGRDGTLFVGSTRGNVHAVSFPAGGTPQVRTIARGLRDPAGVAFRDGALYVSAVSRILRFDDIERRLDDPPSPVVVSDRFPTDGHHGRKFIAFGPDGKLYVPVGAPCNICEPDPDRYANLGRMNPDGSGYEVIARGIRNTVGFDWHPGTGELYFTEHGRDWLGDDAPPDELNRLARPGAHFGYPYCHGGTIRDPEYGSRRPCSEFVAPVQNLGAHVAPLGMRFYTGTQFPAEYRHQVFIAEHGSWNRSRRIGYRITLVRLDERGRAVRYEPFAEGWLQDENVSGRPADVIVAPDGSLLVSDDFSGLVYRIRYARPQ
jgi:glucose/arabinose dehydrogenase